MQKPKLCELLGVEVNERFGIKSSFQGELETFSINENGIPSRYYNGELSSPYQNCALFRAIQSPESVRKFKSYPSKDIDIAKAFIEAGYNWIARDEDGELWIYVVEPNLDKFGIYCSGDGQFFMILESNMKWLKYEDGPVRLSDIRENV